MEESYYRRKSLKPFLLITGLLLVVAGAIQVHYAIFSTELLTTYYSPAEHIAGLVCFYIGVASIILFLVLIGSVFDNEKKKTNTTILLLLFFLGFQAFKDFYPQFLDWGLGWGGLAILLVYAIYRGIAITRLNNQLNVPVNKYGSKLFSFYAWSYLLTFIIILILAIISTVTNDYNVFYNSNVARMWVRVIQIFLDAITWGGIGVKYLIKSINEATIESKVAPRTAPAITTGVKLGMGQYKTTGPKRPTILDEQPKSEEEMVFCTHCGAQNFRKMSKIFCENCGESLD